MLDVSAKKLIFILKYKAKHGQLVEYGSTYFVDLIIEGKISSEVVTYLYNYLYAHGSNNDIALTYYDGTVVLVERNGIDSENQIVTYNLIEKDDIGDVKKRTVRLFIDLKTGIVSVDKQLSYALDSCIDLIVLTKDKQEVVRYSEDALDDLVTEGLRENDYTCASFIDINGDDISYDTYEIMPDGKLISRHVDREEQGFTPVNFSAYTTRKLKELSLLGKEQMRVLEKKIEKMPQKEFKNENFIDNSALDDIDLLKFLKYFGEMSTGSHHQGEKVR